ncbi:hypothetical protein [Pseudomonas sp. F01002]|uniref:hypothetical protein n=1 Tax=Pseudomonas sp. F01002 TaxID=2555724 RepID=UPI00106D263F|nr:hypothetical protein [Pseudomonas sp. F01002]TFB41442.1 hypothetical protein E3W21_09760 [Pseudomonas sp. F01002]
MTAITLSVDGQSIRFALNDLSKLEAVLLNAARRPGKEAFCSTASGRMTAVLELNAPKPGMASTAGSSGQHHFSKSGSGAIQLTDF